MVPPMPKKKAPKKSSAQSKWGTTAEERKWQKGTGTFRTKGSYQSSAIRG